MGDSNQAFCAISATEMARALFAEAGDALLLVDPSASRLVDVNLMAEKLTKASRDDLLGTNVGDWIRHERDHAGWLESMRRSSTFHGHDGFLLRTSPPGDWLPVSLSISRLHLPSSETLALFTIRDRREQVEAYRRLHRTEAELRRVLVSVSDCLWSCRIDRAGQWRYRYLSPVVQRLTGRPVSFFLESTRGWVDIVDPQDQPRYRDFMARIRAGQSEEIEYRIVRPDGRPCWLRESVVSAPPEDNQGQLLHGIVSDITERKLAEEAHHQRKAVESQKLESLGILAGGIAHDFNNLLTGILGNAGLARMALPTNSPQAPALQQIEAIAVRAAELCQQMLAYAGKSTFMPQTLDFNDVVTHALDKARAKCGSVVKFETALTPALPTIQGNASQLEQMVLNLLCNAAEAMEGAKGAVAIETGLTRFAPQNGKAGIAVRTTPDPVLLPAGELASGDYVYLQVRDSGPGIPDAIQSRIFEPFFTTKFTGRGLGLAAVLGIVRSHKGGIHVESKPGNGATFRVLLPRGAAAAASPMLENPGDQRGTILIVDDEDAVHTVMATVIEHAGYKVRQACDGYKAVDMLAKAPFDYSLVIVDLVMPNLDGRKTLQRIRGIRPDMPLIVVSGTLQRDGEDHLRDVPGLLRLAKPFRPAELVELVRATIGANNAKRG